MCPAHEPLILQLELENQTQLADVRRHRAIEKRRVVLASEIRKAREDFRSGKAKPCTPEELIVEITK